MKNMKSLIEKFEALSEEKWSAEVDTKWSPPEGFFKQSADEIAKGLMSASEDLAQAMQRLNFYINRAGENLSSEDKARLDMAKEKLSDMGKEESMDEAAYGMEDGKWNPQYKYSSKEVSAMTANAQMSLEKALKMLKRAYSNGRPEEIIAAVAKALMGVDPLVAVFAGGDMGEKLTTLGHKLFTMSKKAKMEDVDRISVDVRSMFESDVIPVDPQTGLIDFNACERLNESDDKNKKLDLIIKMIKKNDHTGARIAGAEYLGAGKLAEQYRLIQQLQKLEGSLHPVLGKYRDYMDNMLMSIAEQNLSAAEYEKFNSAF